MPDYYEQPAYLKEIESYNTTTTTTNTVGSPADPEPQRRRTAFIFLALVGLILFLVLIFILFRRPSSTGTTPPASDPNQKITLQWWGVFMDEDIIQPLIDEYKTVKPNVTIEYANRWPAGKFDDAAKVYRSELNRVLSKNEPVEIPDIFMVQNHWVGDYELDYIAPSTSFDVDTFRSTFYPAVVSDFSTDNNVYGVPIWFDTFAVLYNKGLLEQQAVSSPPSSWPSFKTLAQNLTTRSSGAINQGGFAAGLSSNVSYSVELLNILMLQNGVAIVDAAGNPVFAGDSDSVTALSFYKSFGEGANSTWGNTFTNDAAAFVEGKLAMTIAPSYRYRDILRVIESNELDLEVEVAQIPQLQNQAQPVINWADYWGNVVAENRPNSVAAWEFLKWITESSQLKKLHANEKAANNLFGFLYPRIDMAEELANDPFLSVYNASLPFAQTWDMVKGIEVKDAFRELISQGSSSQSQIEQTQSEIQSIIENRGNL